MPKPDRRRRRLRGFAATPALAALLAATPVLAQQAPAPATPAPALQPAPPASAAGQVTTNDVTLNLIHLLVQQHIITGAQADALFIQAKQQAATAKGGSASTVAAGAVAGAALAGPAAGPGASAGGTDQTQATAAAANGSHSVHVTYVPEFVRNQIKEEVKNAIEKDNVAQNAPPDELPEWVRRIKITGDFRMRYERDFYDNSNSPYFTDFNTINTGSPYDISNGQTVLPPLLNTTENRQFLAVRARLGITDQVNRDVLVGLRISTGSQTDPVSPNQTIGNDFNKFGATFDRAFVNYQPLPWLKLQLGRFADPWFATDLVWSADLNFDGMALEFAREFEGNLRPFATAGAFPVEDTALSFPSTSATKVASTDKWLFAGQVGASWLISPDYLAKIGFAYYDFQNIQGRQSSPCIATSASIDCNTDDSRPEFVQKGNTLFGIRDLVLPPNNPQASQYQYFGLASPFRLLDVAARFDMARYAPIHLIFDGEAAMNTAFNRAHILSLGPVNNIGGSGSWDSGNLAYLVKLTLGYPEIREFGDWNVTAGYRYLEGDALVDAFTDDHFHGGGTNAKGYLILGNIGLAHNFWFDWRYYSATEITGPPLAVDTLQVELNARF